MYIEYSNEINYNLFTSSQVIAFRKIIETICRSFYEIATGHGIDMSKNTWHVVGLRGGACIILAEQAAKDRAVVT